MRSRRTPDIVPNLDDNSLRELYGSDAEEIIAFQRFLRLPQQELPRDQWIDSDIPRKVIRVPDDSERRVWRLYIEGRIGGARVLERLEKLNEDRV